jgi:hypothetical protein
MMVNDTVLIQHVFGKALELVSLTFHRTTNYCQQHNIDYLFSLAKTNEDMKHFHWGHIPLIKEAMRKGYKNVIYLDADTVIADMNTDMREAISIGKVGAVWHNSHITEPNGLTKDLSHYNVGALYFSNTPLILEFIDKWYSTFPGDGYHAFPLVFEQGGFNILGKEMQIINRIDNKWNAECGIAPSPNPVVYGLHGFKNLKESMVDLLNKLETQS